jgi:hypothetical protein
VCLSWSTFLAKCANWQCFYKIADKQQEIEDLKATIEADGYFLDYDAYGVEILCCDTSRYYGWNEEKHCGEWMVNDAHNTDNEPEK